jgi:hypothetical protein
VCDTPHVNPCGIPQLKVGRDVNGRFRPGNAGGPGNPFARKVAALRKTLLDSVSEQDLADMIEQLKLKARQGDVAAIKLLLQYCVGKPESPKDPDRMDVDEWQRLREMRVGQQEFEKTTEDVPACIACFMAETYWPCNVQDGNGALAQTVHDARAQLDAGNPFAQLPYLSEITTQHDAPADVAPGEPAAATARRPSSANGQRKSDDRPAPAGQARRNGHSPTQPPSSHGNVEEAQRKAVKRPQRPPQPSRPTGQTQRKPPRR